MKWLALFLACLLFHLAGTWSLPLIDRDEPRFAEAAREMLQRSDYVIPYFNNHYRFDKPPLTYWLQTLSYRVFGENDFAARFPSAVAAALVAILLLAWGRRMENVSGRDVSWKRPTNSQAHDPKDEESDSSESRPYLENNIGWWAAIIFTLCLQTFMHAKAAVADMWLVFFVTAAHWAGWELLFSKGRKRPTSNAQLRRLSRAGSSTFNEEVERERGAWWWIFYVALACAFLAKGPIGWTPLLTVAAAKLFLRDADLRKQFAFVRGVVVMLAIVSVWGIPAMIRTHGEFFRVGIGHHVIDRSIGTMEGHGAKSLGVYFLTLPFYFVTLFVSFFPWSIKLPWLTRRLARKQAAGVDDPGYRTRGATDNYLIAGAVVIFLIFTLVKTKLPHYTLPAFPLLALLFARHWTPHGAAARSLIAKPAIIAAGIYLAIALFVFPLTRQYLPSVQLLEASRNDVTREMAFGAVSYNEPSLVWYFRSRTNGFFDSTLDAKSVQPFMKEDGARFVIMPTSLATKIYPALPQDWKSFSTRGINIAKGKRIDLTMILKPE